MSASTRGSGPALWIAGLVCLAAAGGLVWMIASSMHMQPAKNNKSRSPIYAQDPAVGSKIELPPADLAGAPVRPGEAHGSVLLITLPGCSDCTLGDFDPKKVDASRFGEIILLSTGRVFLGTLSKTLPAGKWRFVPDNNDRAALKLNSIFTPRAYALTEDWEVRAIQQPGEDINNFIKRNAG